jgi:hypothetical protein
MRRMSANYYGCRLRANESLIEFFHRFKDSIDNLDGAGVAAPEENIQTIQFINSLDPSGFSEFKTTIRNLSKLGVKAPTTLVDALFRATTSDPILINSSPSEANESVFHQRSFQRGRGRHYPRRKSTQPSQYSEAPKEYQPRSQRPQRLEPRSPFSSPSSSSSSSTGDRIMCTLVEDSVIPPEPVDQEGVLDAVTEDQ